MAPAEADEALAAAIRDHAVAYDIADPDSELLGDYAVIANWQPVDGDERESRYTTHFHRPCVPSHIATGLFVTASNVVADDG